MAEAGFGQYFISLLGLQLGFSAWAWAGGNSFKTEGDHHCCPLIFIQCYGNYTAGPSFQTSKWEWVATTNSLINCPPYPGLIIQLELFKACKINEAVFFPAPLSGLRVYAYSKLEIHAIFVFLQQHSPLLHPPHIQIFLSCSQALEHFWF